jgi:hypothetical protein
VRFVELRLAFLKGLAPLDRNESVARDLHRVLAWKCEAHGLLALTQRLQMGSVLSLEARKRNVVWICVSATRMRNIDFSLTLGAEASARHIFLPTGTTNFALLSHAVLARRARYACVALVLALVKTSSTELQAWLRTGR